MSEPKFTKGPWKFCNDDKGMYQSTDDGKRLKLLFSFDMSFVGLSASEHNANAALIAAAPELYRMLEKLLMAAKTANVLNPVQIHSSLICDVEETLKEARGEK